MIEPALIVKRLVDSLLLPPAGPFLLIIIGLLLSRSRPLTGKILAWTGIVIGLGLSTQMGGQLLAGLLEPSSESVLTAQRLREIMAGPNPPKALVVFTGGSSVDSREKPNADTPSTASLRRAVHAARVARWGDLPILVSGASSMPGRIPEAQTVARVIRDDLRFAVRWVEDTSLDTIENARNSSSLLKQEGIGRVVLVTDALHMRRSMRALQAAGIEVVPAPVGFSGAHTEETGLTWLPSVRGLSLSYSALHELMGLGWMNIRRLAGVR